MHKLPPNLPLAAGALAEPLSVALHAANRLGSKDALQGKTVLVLGAGAVGLLCCAVSKVRGAKTVVVADINADRVAWALDKGFADAGVVVPLGARPETIQEKLKVAQELAALVGAAEVKGAEKGVVGDVDVTFECTGVESCMQAAIYVSLCPSWRCWR